MICLLTTTVRGQQATGLNGLIHVPTADMDTVGMARIGAQFLPHEMVPYNFTLDGEKYNTASNYLSITPFRWIELGYGYTLMKFHKNLNPKRQTGYYAKDRYFSAKIQLINEDQWWPSIAVGGNDVWGSGEDGKSGSNYYKNYFVAASKHIDYSGHLFGAHVAYRDWYRDYNHRWNGVVGGITYQPAFYQPLRAIVEWDGNGVNCGVDCRLYRYFLVQCGLFEGKAFTCGLCFCINLL
jgi:hypothetical protein